MNPNKEVADRLREFGKSKFKNFVEFAKALSLKPQSLNSYLVGKTLPGNKLQAKLRDLGCDTNWLLTGKVMGGGPDGKSQPLNVTANISGVLEFALLKSGMSIAELATKLSIPQKKLIAYSNGKEAISLELLSRICEVLNNAELLQYSFRKTPFTVVWRKDRT